MLQKILSVLASALLVSMGSTPVVAQTTTEAIDDRCNDFSWLLGTWNSYSPWGDRSDPTGGTLVFTMSAGGTVEGRIGSLNDSMEENGYQSGMLVYRGFRETHSYGPTQVTRFQSFNGEYLQLDDRTNEWRPDTIGVRPDGELYMTPPAISRLAGHGPFRRSSGHVSSSVSDACSSAGDASQVRNSEQQPIADKWESILRRPRIAPPILAYPTTLPPEKCLPVHSVRGEHVTDFYNDHREIDARLNLLSGLSGLIGRPESDAEVRVAHMRSFINVLNGILDEYRGLQTAYVMEQDVGLRAIYRERMHKIANHIKPNDDLTYPVGDLTKGGPPLPSVDTLESLANKAFFEDRASEERGTGEHRDSFAEYLDSAYGTALGDSFKPVNGEVDLEAAAKYPEVMECLPKEPIVVDPLPFDDSCPAIQSVRNELPDAAYPYYQKAEALIPNLESAAAALRDLPPNDVVRPALQQHFDGLHRNLQLERAGLSEMALDPKYTADERKKYQEAAQKISQVLMRHPNQEPIERHPNQEPIDVNEALSIKIDFSGVNFDEDSAQGYSSLGADQQGDILSWLAENDPYIKSAKYSEADGYIEIEPNEAAMKLRCETITD